MTLLLEKLLAPEAEELGRKQASLAELEALLADRELELAACLADLNHFEKRYLQLVGRRYALIDVTSVPFAFESLANAISPVRLARPNSRMSHRR